MDKPRFCVDKGGFLGLIWPCFPEVTRVSAPCLRCGAHHFEAQGQGGKRQILRSSHPHDPMLSCGHEARELAVQGRTRRRCVVDGLTATPVRGPVCWGRNGTMHISRGDMVCAWGGGPHFTAAVYSEYGNKDLFPDYGQNI